MFSTVSELTDLKWLKSYCTLRPLGSQGNLLCCILCAHCALCVKFKRTVEKFAVIAR